MTFWPRPLRRSSSALPVLLAACLVWAAPAWADPPERDTRSWSHGSVRISFSVPETYADCRPAGLADVLYTDGVPTSWRLAGRIYVGYVADGVFTVTSVLPVDAKGDIAVTIDYPSHADIVAHTHGVIEYHVDSQIEVFDASGTKTWFVGGDLERAPGTLGPGGQDWDVYCHTSLVQTTAR